MSIWSSSPSISLILSCVSLRAFPRVPVLPQHPRCQKQMAQPSPVHAKKPAPRAELHNLVQSARSRQPINFKSIGPSKGINSATGTLVSDFNGNNA